MSGVFDAQELESIWKDYDPEKDDNDVIYKERMRSTILHMARHQRNCATITAGFSSEISTIKEKIKQWQESRDGDREWIAGNTRDIESIEQKMQNGKKQVKKGAEVMYKVGLFTLEAIIAGATMGGFLLAAIKYSLKV